MKLSTVIEELVEEKGLDRSTISSIVCEGMRAAYVKRYPDSNFRIDYNKKTDELSVVVEKMVVATVADENKEIGIRKARALFPDVVSGSTVWVPFEGSIGRVEILRAKQLIANGIRAVEAEAIYNHFKDRQGSIVVGTIHKCEYAGATVKVDDTLAFLPRSLTIPGEKCVAGFAVRALLKEVLREPRYENQLILDRISPEFLQALFELEIPEVFERLVEIKKIVRIPGYKSKVAVYSNDKNIDPVGTCIGVGGARIKPILKELGSEKVDVIVWSDSMERFIKDSLKPAIVNSVELVDGGTIAHVWVDEEQRSVAIGKMGQNISLASQLTGVSILLMNDVDSSTDTSVFKEQDDEAVID